jgi:hypothetical protein
MRTHFRAVSLLIATAALGAAQTPSILGLNPSSVPAGSAFVLTVSGANFQSGAAIVWNNISVGSVVQSSGQIAASIPSSFTGTPGSVLIQVLNPNNLRSNSLLLTITGSALTISTASLPGGTVGTAYTSTLAATGGVPPYTWTATGSLPAGLALSGTGVLSGTPSAGGSFTIGVKVTDSQGVTATKSLPLSVTGVAITTAATLPNGTASLPYSQTLSVTSGSAPYTWSTGASLPPGLSLSAAGVISGTPSVAGSFSFTIAVTDSGGQSATQTFTVTINPAPLTITTVTPLFDGIVGTLYSQTFSASGGTKPYQWSIVSGNTGDLRLDPVSGALQGTPQTTGTLDFTIQVADNAGARVTGAYTITIRPPSLTIVTAASLPQGAVGGAYSQQFSVVGGTPPYTWSLTSGSVPGLSFNASQVILAGTPSTAGTFTFTLQARDSAGLTVSRSFTIVIGAAALTITTDTQLPDGTLGAPYSYQMSAAGGSLPYTWSATGLPAGLTIDPNTGIISGILNAAEPPPFAIRVVDSARLSATNQFRINAALPRVPTVTLSGLPASIGPAQQVALQIGIDSAFPAAISGQAIVSFSPEVGGGDGTIQFSTGGVTAPFTIPAGATTAAAAIALQTGTVAGQLSVSLRLQAAGLDVTPSPAPVISAHIDQAAPVIQSATFTRSGNGFSIQIAGYSTAREITQAVFTFAAGAGQTLQSSQITVPVDTIFGGWYQDATHTAYGSQFVYTQPFTIQGDATAVTPQSVTLVNRKGTVTATLGQ